MLAGEIASPDVIDAIDKTLEENERERNELQTLRKLAVHRHGRETPFADVATTIESEAKALAAPREGIS